jgi:hypothetical protein
MTDPRHSSGQYSSMSYRLPQNQAYAGHYSSGYGASAQPPSSPAYQVPSYGYATSSAAIQGVAVQQGYPMPPSSRGPAGYSTSQVPSGVPGHPSPYGNLSDGMDPARNAYSQRSYSLPQGYGAPAAYPYDDGTLSPSGGPTSDHQYPASPQRPFACDMCPLSFSRQHDLKRHRETHSGEKPFLCNGGCGKTFTRKDALKRHQVRRQLATIVDL